MSTSEHPGADPDGVLVSYCVVNTSQRELLVRGLDALAVTFIAPHSLHARPLVVPRGLPVTVTNRTPDIATAVLVDGHQVGEMAPGASITVAVNEARSLLATLPETTFFGRYRATFA